MRYKQKEETIRTPDNKADGYPEQRVLDKALRHEINAAANAGQFRYKDPVYHVSESFSRTFDFYGKSGSVSIGGETENTLSEANKEDKDQKKQEFLAKFTQTAFSRGKLSSAIMRGTGDVMLLSCLERSAGQTMPKSNRGRKVFESGASRQETLPGPMQAKVYYNEGAIYSAVGLVVGAIKNAKAIVSTLAELAEGDGEIRTGSGAETLLNLYPFLSDRNELELLDRLNEMLQKESTAADVNKKMILQRAYHKTQAVIEQKKQKRSEFANHLKEISRKSKEAQERFKSREFMDIIETRMTQPDAAVEDDGNSEDDTTVEIYSTGKDADSS